LLLSDPMKSCVIAAPHFLHATGGSAVAGGFGIGVDQAAMLT
jgi:hypothetical protein